MHVLVAYASRHGATRGIAERIADRLNGQAVAADARAVSSVRDLSSYDAFVIGSAAYMYHWLREAEDFTRRNRALLATRPVWIFSSGPIGTDTVDKAGRDVLVTSEPKEWPELKASLHPRGARIFFGAFDPSAPAVGLAERFMQHLPASARNAMPAGDFRDWPLIDAWADEIATQLASPVGGTR
jgi:menaquinone-dependent protoporphyrinogen oxidase